MFTDPLDERAAAAVELLRSLPERSRVSVLADADIDGIASATILTKALLRTRTRFHVRLTRRRDPSLFDQIFDEEPDLVIVADFGSGFIDRFLEARVPTIVCDHHAASKDGHGTTLAHLNPHLVGEDGSRTASGAAVSWVFARAWLADHGRSADDLLPYALLGAHGDRHHGAGEAGGLHGRIRAATKGPHPAGEGLDHIEPITGIERHVTWQKGPALARGPLSEALALALDPYIATFQGDPEKAAEALKRIGLDPEKPLSACNADQHRTFSSWLTLLALEQGADPDSVTRLFEPVPSFPRYDGLDVATLADLVDAACREDVATEGLIGLLGSDRDREPLAARVAEYTGKIRSALESAFLNDEPRTFGPATFFQVDEGAYAGPVADRLMSWTRHGNTPLIIGGPLDGRGFKVSMRARPPAKRDDGKQVTIRWRLDEAAAKAGRATQGNGGGHALAAGAIVALDDGEALLGRIGKALATAAGGKTQEASAT